MTAVDDRQLTEEELTAAKARQDSLRATYRTLQDMDARQRSIVGEITQISAIDNPDEGDLSWQETLIQEHDDLDELAKPLRKRAANLARVQAAHADPANREDGVVRTPDLATRNVIGGDPFRDLERVRKGLVEPS